MENLVKKFYRSSIITAIILIILGLLLVFEADTTIKTISYIIGGALVLVGALAVVKFIKNINNPNRGDLDIIYGIVTMVFGMLIINYPEAIASIIPFVMGVGIILSSANKLQCAFVLKAQKNKMWKITMIISIISALCGIVLIFNPFEGAVVLTKIVGIFIIGYAILDIVSTLTIKRNVGRINKKIKENIKEATIIEE